MADLPTPADRRCAPQPASAIPSPRSGFFSRHQRLVQGLAVVALLAGIAYLTWRIGWTRDGIHLALFVPLLAAEVFGWCSIACYTFLAWSVPKTATPAALPGVAVDVFVCTYDESISVVEATLVGCRAMTMPHTTYLLDDGRRPEMKNLAQRLDARYVTRSDNAHAKAGNINHALGVTNGELILVLDADHVPMPGILDTLTGYFADPGVAIVQSPHDFSNRDSAQHTKEGRHEQTLFYHVIAPGKDRHNAMFWCGSATVVRRTALVEVGGVLTDTIAEDFHTTIAIHARGWKTRYHDEVLVQGLAPHDVAGFLLQRARWARGNLAVFRTKENPLTCAGLTAKQRLSYFASLLNYFSGLQRLTLLLVLTATLATGLLPMQATIVGLAAIWLPWSVLAFGATLGLARGALGPLDSTRYGLLTMGINLRGIGALFTRRVAPFKVTPKEGIDTGGLGVIRMFGLLATVGVALTVAWILRLFEVAGVLALRPLPTFATVVVVLLGAWEMVCIGKTLAPLVRRRQLRADFRTPVLMRARIAGSAERVDVVDLSVDGIGFARVGDVPVGTTLELLTRFPDAHGALHDATLPVEVRSCATAADGMRRVGCRFGSLDETTRLALIEYCDVVLANQRLGAAPTMPPAPVPKSETLTA